MSNIFVTSPCPTAFVYNNYALYEKYPNSMFRGVHQLVWVKSKMSLAGTLFPPPTNRLSAHWMCMWRGTVMCHAPHAGTFLEKGWIEEIFNRNRENNKEMNRDNKINRDS